MQLLIDLHANNKRQGPGSDKTFCKAIELSEIDVQSELQVVDIGCGTGVSSLALAQATKAHITSVDLFPQFLKVLEENANKENLTDRITTIEADMAELPFRTEQFDVIWAEGAIYNIGFENGIKDWRKFLKPGGRIVLTEITWLRQDIPQELRTHWEQEYPEIASASKKIAQLEQNGYKLLGYFPLSHEAWDEYYGQLEAGFADFLKRNNSSKEAQSIVDAEKHEIALYTKYKEYISYGCYIAAKV